MTRKKNLNALKHGGYTEALMLPEEDPEEFEKLQNALIDEWEPDGPTERDKVLSVAMNMWRKRRYRRFLQETIDDAEWYANTWRHLQKREDDRLLKFLEDYNAGILSPITEEDLSGKLGAKWASRIKANVPRSKFETDSAWLNEVIGFIIIIIIESSEKIPNIRKSFSDEEMPERELAFEERIDAKIAKDLKELGQMKTMKAVVLGKSRPSVPGQELKVVESPSIEPAQKSLTHNPSSQMAATPNVEKEL